MTVYMKITIVKTTLQQPNECVYSRNESVNAVELHFSGLVCEITAKRNQNIVGAVIWLYSFEMFQECIGLKMSRTSKLIESIFARFISEFLSFCDRNHFMSTHNKCRNVKLVIENVNYPPPVTPTCLFICF